MHEDIMSHAFVWHCLNISIRKEKGGGVLLGYQFGDIITWFKRFRTLQTVRSWTQPGLSRGGEQRMRWPFTSWQLRNHSREATCAPVFLHFFMFSCISLWPCPPVSVSGLSSPPSMRALVSLTLFLWLLNDAAASQFTEEEMAVIR